MRYKNLIKWMLFLALTYGCSGLVGQRSLDKIAQEKVGQGDIHLIAKYFGDSTVLRWGYDHPSIWYGNLNKGVEIYRRNKNQEDSEYELVAEKKLKSEAELEQMIRASATPDMLMVITEQAYRNWENTKYEGSADGLFDKSDNFYSRWSLFHFAADRDPIAADAAGLRWVDHKVEPGQTYAYKIVTKGSPYGRAFKVVRPYISSFQPIIYDHVAYDEKVIIQWEKPLHDIHYSAYNIEKKKGDTWVQVNELPYVQMMDEALDIEQRFFTYPIPLTPGEKTEVRLIGLDPFGDQSDPSESIMVETMDRTPPPPPLVYTDTAQIHLGVKLWWEQPPGEPIQHYDLLIIQPNQEERKQAWARNDRREGIVTFARKGIHRIKLMAIDKAGNASESPEIMVNVPDLLPPSQPTGIKAHVDTAGIITLKWDKAPESDIIGYYVFGADGDDRNMHRLTTEVWRARTYFDTIDMSVLNEKKYYQVVAIDDDYKKSPFSEILEVNRPDITPPSPAHFSDYEIMNQGVVLSLVPSSSRDVVQHIIERKVNHPDSIWRTIKLMTDVPRKYTDKNIIPSTTYRYRLVAVDEVALRSAVMKDLVITTGGLELIKPTLQASIQEKTIQLSWESSSLAQIVILYRSEGEGPMQKLVSVPASKNKYTDSNINLEKNYTYRIRMVEKSGKKSPFSESIKLGE